MDKVYYQMETSNKSFIDTHIILKKRGIKNNKCFLALLNLDLAGINPYDPALTDAQKEAIIKECQNNYWYYLREVVRISAYGTTIQLELNIANLSLSYLLNAGVKKIVHFTSRQLGMKIAYLAYTNYAKTFGDTQILSLIDKKMDDSKNTKSICIDMYENLTIIFKY